MGRAGQETLGVEMKIKIWNPEMTDKEKADLAYWERNVLALKYADGFYKDFENNYDGWLRVLSLEGGKITFHIPDGFDVGNLPEVEVTWDGHTTEEKWQRILAERGVNNCPPHEWNRGAENCIHCGQKRWMP